MRMAVRLAVNDPFKGICCACFLSGQTARGVQTASMGMMKLELADGCASVRVAAGQLSNHRSKCSWLLIGTDVIGCQVGCPYDAGLSVTGLASNPRA